MTHNVLPTLHAFNASREGDRIALALPRMETITYRANGAVEAMGEALAELRLFARPEALEAFLEMQPIQRLARTQMIRRPRLREIGTDECEGFASYHRLRRGERYTRAAILRSERRYQRRAEKRGEMRDSATLAKRRVQRINEREREQQAEHRTVFVPMESSSTGGQRFSLLIEERSAGQASEGDLNSYGLSRVAEGTSPFAVPHF